MVKQIKTMEALSVEIGISRPTLSKYFADPSSVRDSMRERIETAMAKVDYVPNFFARNLNRRQTRLFGVVIPHLNDLFYMNLLQEIERRAEELDCTIMIQNSHDDPQKELQAIENFRSMNAEGVIISPIGASENTAEFERLHQQIPIVFLDAKGPGLEDKFSFVGTDNEQSIQLMVDYLSRSGTPPIFLGMPSVNSNSQERERAYCTRMEALGYEPTLLAFDWSDEEWNFEAYAYQLLKDCFARNEHCEATILCANDRLAMGALRAANEAGLLQQQDGKPAAVRVAGHDDHPLSSYVWPSLTTVSQDVTKIARAAVDCIYAEARSPEGTPFVPVEHLLPVQLQLRDSA